MARRAAVHEMLPMLGDVAMDVAVSASVNPTPRTVLRDLADWAALSKVVTGVVSLAASAAQMMRMPPTGEMAF